MKRFLPESNLVFKKKKFVNKRVILTPPPPTQITSSSLASSHTNNICRVGVLLQGGLGNRLFQCATAFGIARKRNCGFSIHSSPNIHSLHDYKKSIFRKCVSEELLNSCMEFIEQPCHAYLYNPPRSEKLHGIFDEKLSLNLLGYFQNEKYFQDYYQELLILFEMEKERKEKLTAKYNKTVESYFLHIRLGDYVNNPTHFVPLDIYFQHAVEMIQQQNPNVHFYILSDGKFDDCVAFLKNVQNYTFVEEKDEVDNLYLMSLCQKGGVCSNSSFSWWGAYLNPNPLKNIYFPSKWINKPWKIDVYPEKAIVIDTENGEIISVNKNHKIVCFITTCTKSAFIKRREKQSYTIEKLKKFGFSIYYVVGQQENKNRRLIKNFANGLDAIVVAAGDEYEDLSLKMMDIFSIALSNNEVSGVLKIDDDTTIMDEKVLVELIQFSDKYDYMGGWLNVKNETNDMYHVGRCSNLIWNRTSADIKNSLYFGGPFYFLSRDAIKQIRETGLKTLLEDASVGESIAENPILTLYNRNWYERRLVDWDNTPGISQTRLFLTLILEKENLSKNLENIFITMELADKNKRKFVFTEETFTFLSVEEKNLFLGMFPTILWVEKQISCVNWVNWESILDTESTQKHLIITNFTPLKLTFSLKVPILMNPMISKKEFSQEKKYFFVFSENQAAAEILNYKKFEIIFIDMNEDEFQNLYLMSQCCGGVCTDDYPLSWWGAYSIYNPSCFIIEKKKNTDTLFFTKSAELILSQ